MFRISLSHLCSQCPLELAPVPAEPPPASIPSYTQAILLSQFLQLRALSTWRLYLVERWQIFGGYWLDNEKQGGKEEESKERKKGGRREER